MTGSRSGLSVSGEGLVAFKGIHFSRCSASFWIFSVSLSAMNKFQPIRMQGTSPAAILFRSHFSGTPHSVAIAPIGLTPFASIRFFLVILFLPPENLCNSDGL